MSISIVQHSFIQAIDIIWYVCLYNFVTTIPEAASRSAAQAKVHVLLVYT